MSKYQRWHDQIIERAKSRKPLGGYCETHHVLPRSLGGDDYDSNLVSLTYREHFLIHWLLTKVHTGGALRRMQMALQAMTLPVSSGRVVTAWRTRVARKAISLLEDDPEVWVVRARNVVAEREAKRLRLVEKSKRRSAERDEFKQAMPATDYSGLKPGQLDAIATKLLGLHKRVKIPVRHSSAKSPAEKEILATLRRAHRHAKKERKRSLRTDGKLQDTQANA